MKALIATLCLLTVGAYGQQPTAADIRATVVHMQALAKEQAADLDRAMASNESLVAAAAAAQRDKATIQAEADAQAKQLADVTAAYGKSQSALIAADERVTAAATAYHRLKFYVAGLASLLVGFWVNSLCGSLLIIPLQYRLLGAAGAAVATFAAVWAVL